MTIISRYLDTNGDGTGTKDFIGNYASSLTRAKIKPAADETYNLSKLIVTIEGTGFTSAKYGPISGGLTNGIRVVAFNKDSTEEILDFTDGSPILTNADWGSFSYDISLKSWGAGNDVIFCRVEILRTNRPLIISGEDEQTLEVLLNDDFSTLVHHKFLVQGNFD